jgi:hypothetical protein
MRTYTIKVWLNNEGIDTQLEMYGCENVLFISRKNILVYGAIAAWKQSVQKNAWSHWRAPDNI